MTCPCRPAPTDRCPAKRPGVSCSLPAGHGVVHAKCVHAIGHVEHRAYEWRDRCHEEVADEDGMAEPCNRPATTTRTDPDDGHEYAVCDNHKEPDDPA